MVGTARSVRAEARERGSRGPGRRSLCSAHEQRVCRFGQSRDAPRCLRRLRRRRGRCGALPARMGSGRFQLPRGESPFPVNKRLIFEHFPSPSVEPKRGVLRYCASQPTLKSLLPVSLIYGKFHPSFDSVRLRFRGASRGGQDAVQDRQRPGLRLAN